MERHDYVVATAGILRHMMNEIAELHLPRGMSLHGPNAHETALWLAEHLQEIAIRTEEQLQTVDPPRALTDLHQRLRTRWGPHNQQMSEFDALRCDNEFGRLCESEDVECPVGPEDSVPTSEEHKRAAEHLDQLMAEAYSKAIEAEIRAEMPELSDEEVTRLMEYLRTLDDDDDDGERADENGGLP